MAIDDDRYDLVIVGSGAAGFAAALRGRALGLDVAMVEDGTLGGTCVNTGCIPSKTLLAAAEANGEIDGRFPGIRGRGHGIDMPDLIAGKDALVEGLRAERYQNLVDWDLIDGTARFMGTATEPVLRVGGPAGARSLTAHRFVIATGAKPWLPPIPGLSAAHPLDSTAAMALTELPESLIVLGGGYVGIEQAHLFARLGSRVTLLTRSRLVSTEDAELSAALRTVLEDDGIAVVEHARITAVDRAENGVSVQYATDDVAASRIRGSELLAALGRRPVTAALGLDAIGVEAGERGEVLVDPTLTTSNPRILAAGDVTATHQFVYVAAAQGTLAVDAAFDASDRRLDYRTLPRVIFTEPAAAVVGLSEAQARGDGLRVHTRVLDLTRVPRALVNRDTRGFVKVVADATTDRILGISAVATSAGELAAAGGYILAGGLTVTDVAQQWSPYLTMSEAIKLACQAFTTDIARLSCCAI